MIFVLLHKQIEQKCDVCSEYDEPVEEGTSSQLSKLNDSQANAILTCLATVRCHHKASIELICGPPGTGKTRTLSVMLVELLHKKCRTVTCTPKDVTTARVASYLVKLVQESSKNGFDGFCPLGDILLFGNKNCDYGEDITEISLDYRVNRLAECLAPTTGWNDCLSSMISFLEELSDQEGDFAPNPQFTSTASSLRRCMLMICTHVPLLFLRKENVDRMVDALSFLGSLEKMLFSNQQPFEKVSLIIRSLVLLKDLRRSLRTLDFPFSMSKDPIKEFCIQMASSVFCTTSTSYKLHSVESKPFDLLVVDDADQLKECEAVIPLQLRGLKHVVLAGAECQLTALVKSRVRIPFHMQF